jgi:Immunoglobulin domain
VADNGKEDIADAVLTVLETGTAKLKPNLQQCTNIFIFSAVDEPDGFPKITQVSSASKVVELGQNTALNCETTGNPKPQITWLKEMNPINYTKHVFITPDGKSWLLAFLSMSSYIFVFRITSNSQQRGVRSRKVRMRGRKYSWRGPLSHC